ncbi:hypothetical protein IWQ56_001023 [Coemansia nantahalensis]|uniref:Uncharacterized protein n=1 Tax=Coemansia helicoidea TaxID=1286919 RepID=A0ACC1LEK4_9FUNG|nr:hypothetical protein IWQ56_001023 [Coemansia nantahalensis]KAJ2806881.1 hypothetical protein H4R21_000691 [Coemansia helicoidea]
MSAGQGDADEKWQNYREAFSLFDKDGSGTITSDELRELLKSLGHRPSDQELSDMINEVDMDGNGEIDFDEFVGMMERQRARTFITDAELETVFNKVDEDKDGSISDRQAHAAVKLLGYALDDKPVAAVLNGAAAKPTLDLAAFTALVRALPPLPEDPDAEYKEAFNVFDKDGNGRISKTELRQVMVSLGENLNDDEIDAMFGEADTNKDDAISFDEFKAMMKGK